jgi:hypothetical protein
MAGDQLFDVVRVNWGYMGIGHQVWPMVVNTPFQQNHSFAMAVDRVRGEPKQRLKNFLSQYPLKYGVERAGNTSTSSGWWNTTTGQQQGNPNNLAEYGGHKYSQPDVSWVESSPSVAGLQRPGPVSLGSVTNGPYSLFPLASGPSAGVTVGTCSYWEYSPRSSENPLVPVVLEYRQRKITLQNGETTLGLLDSGRILPGTLRLSASLLALGFPPSVFGQSLTDLLVGSSAAKIALVNWFRPEPGPGPKLTGELQVMEWAEWDWQSSYSRIRSRVAKWDDLTTIALPSIGSWP